MSDLAEAIASLKRPMDEPPGFRHGYGESSFVFDENDTEMRVGGQTVGKKGADIHGDILVDDTSNIKPGIFGLPIKVNPNPSGLIPSTLFTPMPAFTMGVDPIIIELGIYAAFAAAIAAIGLSTWDFNE
jgi:hypothetical protein